jgi:1-aminocyclopropane-1-carboxylate deaminase/D-cysteine desulfhydrase-like pyridoxal-dependent ACC family enzyme
MTATTTRPRLRLAPLPTPLEPLHQLGAALGLSPGQLFVKRDDLTGLAMGGNKVRKLEYSLAAAAAASANCIVTGGAAQSNHVRLTAAAARRSGMACSVVLVGAPPEKAEGNVLLTLTFGAQVTWIDTPDHTDLGPAISALADAERASGNTPYVLPPGGSSTEGNLAYVAAAQELREQCPGLALVVTADASGGTHAGLAAGFGDHALVLGVDVGLRADLIPEVARMARDTASEWGVTAPRGEPQLDRSQIGGGYGCPTVAGRNALDLCVDTEGMILEPTYTAKAMAALIMRAQSGELPAGPVIFLHTGGYPELFTGDAVDWLTNRRRA